jgi:ubiquitin carboxyl-terminal hydrolase 5/13
VPTKVDVPVIVGDEAFLLDDYKSPGLQPMEELLPEEDVVTTQSSFVPNQEALSNLEQMGFPTNRCEKALHATGNSDANMAMEWLFAHMDDPDIDEPLIRDRDSGPTSLVDTEKIESLGQMGFGPPQARKALKETGGDMERAVDWLFSHPDDQGDFGEEEPVLKASPSIQLCGTEILPAKFELQSIICHKGGSIHAG